METKQETKSLPRNRKCGNCRYFEPAPLWRKGWCRNPRLYDRRANHLVDAATIDCEQVFRARIYWEPVPTPQPIEQEVVSVGSYAEPGTADGGERSRSNSDGVLRSAANRPLITRREKSAATPNLVAKASVARKWLRDNIPYYDRVDGPISRLNLKVWLPWAVIFVLLLVVLINLGGNKTPNVADSTPATVSSSTAAVTSVAKNGSPAATTSSAAGASSGAKQPTATLSTALPTATAIPASPTALSKTLAKVVGTDKKGVRMRKDPHVTTATEATNVVVTIPEGAEVEITGAFKSAEGIEWWPISYKGQNGWVARDYLQKV